MSSYMLFHYDQWLEQPINVPLDEYAPVQDARICPVKGNTAQLLNEFNQVYDAVELIHLTPPETPPQTPPQTPLQAYLNDSKNQFYPQPITNYQLQYNQPYQQQCKPTDVRPTTVNYSSPSITAQQFPSILEQAITLVQQSNLCEDIGNCDDEMAQVEALVRSRAEDLVESSIDDDSSLCGSSSCFSPRSETSSSATDDSDWTMQTSSVIAMALKNKQTKQKRKPRINRRSVEDRQSRKKEQNKTAANRYRLKKKAEIEILLDEERELIKQNDRMKSQYKDVSREVKYIKSLLRDLFKAKGLLD
ncbi:activating transcription factor of chaperone isoform X2 [Contarinia nasturtii]|uniref:activating transcription factor of chaperone isoform X2 n=1 Tax=Contarinia nasturtii TaxID=265458 RepID=UPI0012D381B4|nr:activating transcription factor of chaperone isoform X2 [Contarinia nasturtii]